MKIAGLQKTTLIDYPEKIACTVFTHGCNFRCPFCHNPELVTEAFNSKECISEESFFKFLNSRKKMLDGVVITGGEPCLQKNLASFMRKVKKNGFDLKLDTNGSFPEVLEALLAEGLLDYVAMDVKTNLEAYKGITGGFDNIDSIARSVEILKGSKIDYEFRTTVVKGLHKKKDIERISNFLEGCENFSLQNFKCAKTIVSDFTKENEFSIEELEEFKSILGKNISNVFLKNNY